MATETSLGLIKPAVNDPTDQDLWGGYLNENFDSLNTWTLDTPSVETSGFSVATEDHRKLFLCDATGGAITVTLPAASAVPAGCGFGFKKTDASANAITLDADGTDTIQGGATYSISRRYALVYILSNGTDTWFIKYASTRTLINIQRFFANGTYTPTSGATTADAQLFGSSGGGGGGAGSSTSGSDGTAGSNVTFTGFSQTLVAVGGALGAAGSAAGSGSSGINGADGTASGGDNNITGNGMVGGSGGHGQPSSGVGSGGDGGAGGYVYKANISVSGSTAAIVIGAAGAGGTAGTGGSPRDGKNGKKGYIVIEEYA